MTIHMGSAGSIKKSGGNSMYYGVIGLVVVITFLILATTVFFKINTVIITGSSVYTYDEIIAASGIQGGDNLVRTNMDKCARQIEQQLTYVETAELTRSFPSTVEIKITPCKETASAEYEEGFCLLSASGKILDMSSEPYPDTVVIYGARLPEKTEEIWEEETSASSSAAQTETNSGTDTSDDKKEESKSAPLPGIGGKFVCADENRTEVFYRLIDISQNYFNGKAESFDMSDHYNISCIYDGRITIELGSVSELDYKLRLASDIISTKIGPTTEGTLKMLSNGASFIDKAGLEQNEITYQNNIAAKETENSTEENTDISGENSGETETSAVIHFE